MFKYEVSNILFGLVLFSTSFILAHGDLSKRIIEKSIEISKDSTNSKLYFERGYLYHQHFEFNKALSDYLKSEDLGLTNKLLNYRKAEVCFNLSNYPTALTFVNKSINIDLFDAKRLKLKAQILMKLMRSPEALEIYNSIIKSKLNLRPEDFIEYSALFLSIDSLNFNGAINAIDIGLNKLGKKIITLRLKKIDYLKRWNQTEKVINQYNALILEYKRKEFWYYNKGVYLYEICRLSDSNLALQQAKLSIDKLKPKFKNTIAVKKLNRQIDQLEKHFNYEN